MTEQEFYNLMAGVAELRRFTQDLFTVRVWFRIGEVEISYSFKNVATSEAYDLNRSIFTALPVQLAVGNARITYERQPIRV